MLQWYGADLFQLWEAHCIDASKISISMRQQFQRQKFSYAAFPISPIYETGH